MASMTPQRTRPGLAEEVAARLTDIRFGPGAWRDMSNRAKLDQIATADALIRTTSLADFVAYFSEAEPLVTDHRLYFLGERVRAESTAKHPDPTTGRGSDRPARRSRSPGARSA